MLSCGMEKLDEAEPIVHRTRCDDGLVFRQECHCLLAYAAGG